MDNDDNFPRKKLPFDRRILRDQIREYLVDAIINGVYSAGERIVETRVAQELGVSQGAVREALRELEWMGFLETKPYSGSYVRAMSSKDLLEIYPVRAALEGLAARLAVPHLTEEELDYLKHLIEKMVDVSRKGDERGMVECNYAFHRTIVHASHNAVLIRAWSMFQFSYWTTVSTAELNEELVFLAERHWEVLEALRSRDPERAALAMEDHIIGLISELEHRKPRTVNSRPPTSISLKASPGTGS